MDQLARAIRGARLLVLCSPSNPTGGILSAEDLEQLAWWAERHDVLILSDEVFERYHHETAPASIGTMAKGKQRTLTVGSVSKSHALAWARVGWIAAYRHLLRPCVATAALRAPFVPTLCQQIALAALRIAPETFEPILEQFEARRHYAFDRLTSMSLQPAWPHGGFFLWTRVPPGWRSGRAFADALLAARRVRVTPGDLFGPSGAAFVRISYACEDGRLEEGLNRLAEQVRGEKAQPPLVAA
jgi:aspartate/methionine/tyrosine aminotransferase